VKEDGVSLGSVNLEGWLVSVIRNTEIICIRRDESPQASNEIERPKIIVRLEVATKTAKEIHGALFNSNTGSHSNARSSIVLSPQRPSVGSRGVSPKVSIELEVGEVSVVSETAIEEDHFFFFPVVVSHENSHWR